MNEAAEIRVDALPEQLQRIIAAVGLDAAERLLAAKGGTRIKRPCNEAQWARAARALGSIELAEALWAEFVERLWIDLPTAKKLAAQRRNASIRAQRGAKRAEELAIAHGVTASYVRALWADGE